jgi:NitT/TauT family transport system substrate-binding protein
MRKQRGWQRRAAVGVVSLALVAAACGGDDDDDDAATTEAPGTEAPGTEAPGTDAPEATTADTDAPASTDPAGSDAPTGSAAPVECEGTDSIKLQLQWATQAQFGGYFAADDQGFYEAMCLDVELIETGVDVVPQQPLADGQVDFAIAWVPKALATREQGADIVNIAQIFQRSGTLQVSFKDAGIETAADFAGKRIGNWGFGNEYEIFAALAKEGIDPATGVELVAQQFNMDGLLNGEIDAAEAMTYNEYAQVLEAENPDTGELYTPDDLNVVSYEEEGVGMLQDAIWADGERLANDPEYEDMAARFVAASIQGWAFCRDDPEACRDIVVAAGSSLGNSHQLWQMNAVNQLIWPSPLGIGMMDEAAWDRTVEIAQNTPNLEGTTVLTAPPDDGAYTTEIVEAAHAMLGDSVDLVGQEYEPIEVTLEPGGS